MTSTNDGKEVKSDLTSGPKGKTYFIQLYKSLEASLSGNADLPSRCSALESAWSRVHCLCTHSAPSTHPHLLTWLQRHTACALLQTEWQQPSNVELHTRFRDAIDAFIAEATAAAAERGAFYSWETSLVHRAEWFKKVIPDPWGHPVLRKLLDQRGEQPTDDEILEWLKEERGVMFVTRLRQLATSKCDDLALSLATAVMERARVTVVEAKEDSDIPPIAERNELSKTLTDEAGFTPDVWEQLTDIEFVLHHKQERTARCIELAKQIPLRSGYQLVERLRTRLEVSPREKKLWKNAKDVATIVAQVIITRCMVRPCVPACRAALYCCARALVRLVPAPRLPPAAAALAAPAVSADHLHTLAHAVHAQLKDTMKPFVCELYVRAITAGMNELERLKLKTEKESEASTRAMEQTLSSWFVQLGTLLGSSPRLGSECALTAFSLHPAPAMFQRLLRLPPLPVSDVQETKTEPQSEFGSWSKDSRTQSNLVKTSETLNLKQSQRHQANVLSTAILTEGERLGLSPELCQDLAVLLSGPRVKTLSWDMDREQLLINCSSYMEARGGGTRSLITELKYLNLDLAKYQHLPEEDDEDQQFYGIERGYEHLVELQEDPEPEPEEIWADALTDYSEISDACYTDDEYTEHSEYKKSNKKHRKMVYSSEEIDPLSIPTTTTTTIEKVKKERKNRSRHKDRSKERSHSTETSISKLSDLEQFHNQELPLEQQHSKEIPNKEKTKHKHKSKNRESSVGKKDKPKKEKKERKEKIGRKLPPPLPDNMKPANSLSQLIGMKVCTTTQVATIEKTPIKDKKSKKTESVSDSDYDSQGKSSLASITSIDGPPESDVLFDGLFSMDELKTVSPMKPQVDNCRELSNELSFQNGSVIMSNVSVNNFVPQPPQEPCTNLNKLKDVKANVDSNIKYGNPVGEDVRQRINSLLQFRKQKSMDSPLSSPKSVIHETISPKVEKTVKKYGPKILDVTSDKAVISKALSKSPIDFVNRYYPELNLTTLNKESVLVFNQNKEKTKKESVIKSIAMPVDTVLKTVAKQSVYNNTKLPSPSLASVEVRTPGVQKIYGMKDFLSELKAKASAKTEQKSGTKELATKSLHKAFMKLAQTNDVIVCKANPVNTSPNLIKPKRAKPLVQQKKVEYAPNTFSRLSYMHKNKQIDTKTKQNVDLPPQRPMTQQEAISDELERHIKGFQLQKLLNSTKTSSVSVNHMQHTTSESSVSSQNIKASSKSVNNPAIVGILTSDTRRVTTVHKETENQDLKTNVPTTQPYTPHIDEKEFLSLVQQRNLLNAQNTISEQMAINKIAQNLQNLENLVSDVNTSNTNTIIQPSYQNPTIENDILENKILHKSNVVVSQPPAIIPRTETSAAVAHHATHASISGAGVPEISNATKSTVRQNYKKIIKHDLKNVMDALLAHKTPSRGHNALDMALNPNQKETMSILRQQRISKPQIIKKNEKLYTPILSAPKTHTGVITPSIKVAPPIPYFPGIKFGTKLEKSSINKKSELKPGDIMKFVSPSVIIKKVQKKQSKHKILSSRSESHNIKNKSKCVPGNQNADEYELLDELMDQDLLQEIGELSDEEFNSDLFLNSTNKAAMATSSESNKFTSKPLNMNLPPKRSIIESKTLSPHERLIGSRVQIPVNEQVTLKTNPKVIVAPAQEKPPPKITVDSSVTPVQIKHNAPVKSQANAYNFVQQNVIPQYNILLNNQVTTETRTNILITPAPITGTISNMVLLRPNIVTYPSVQVQETHLYSPNICQVNQDTFLPNAHNLAMYQSPQYSEPVVKQIIVGNTSINNNDVQENALKEEQHEIQYPTKNTPSANESDKSVNFIAEGLNAVPGKTKTHTCKSEVKPDTSKLNIPEKNIDYELITIKDRKILSEVQEQLIKSLQNKEDALLTDNTINKNCNMLDTKMLQDTYIETDMVNKKRQLITNPIENNEPIHKEVQLMFGSVQKHDLDPQLKYIGDINNVKKSDSVIIKKSNNFGLRKSEIMPGESETVINNSKIIESENNSNNLKIEESEIVKTQLPTAIQNSKDNTERKAIKVKKTSKKLNTNTPKDKIDKTKNKVRLKSSLSVSQINEETAKVQDKIKTKKAIDSVVTPTRTSKRILKKKASLVQEDKSKAGSSKESEIKIENTSEMKLLDKERDKVKAACYKDSDTEIENTGEMKLLDREEKDKDKAASSKESDTKVENTNEMELLDIEAALVGSKILKTVEKSVIKSPIEIDVPPKDFTELNTEIDIDQELISEEELTGVKEEICNMERDMFTASKHFLDAEISSEISLKLKEKSVCDGDSNIMGSKELAISNVKKVKEVEPLTVPETIKQTSVIKDMEILKLKGSLEKTEIIPNINVSEFKHSVTLLNNNISKKGQEETLQFSTDINFSKSQDSLLNPKESKEKSLVEPWNDAPKSKTSIPASNTESPKYDEINLSKSENLLLHRDAKISKKGKKENSRVEPGDNSFKSNSHSSLASNTETSKSDVLQVNSEINSSKVEHSLLCRDTEISKKSNKEKSRVEPGDDSNKSNSHSILANKTETSSNNNKNDVPTNKNDKSPSVEAKKLMNANSTVDNKEKDPITDIMQNIKYQVIKYVPPIDGKQGYKIVRIATPDGKSFLVTIYGSVKLDFHSFINNPQIRQIVTSNSSASRRFKLNIKHASVSGRLLTVEKAQEISEPDSNNIETVDLISDEDLEIDKTQSILTEFGKYKVVNPDELLDKHQMKFNQKCFIKLIKKPDSYFKQQTSRDKVVEKSPENLTFVSDKNVLALNPDTILKPSPEQSTNITELERAKINVECTENNLKTDGGITEIIELGDSSSDEVDLVSGSVPSPSTLNITIPANKTVSEPEKKINEFKNLLLNDLGVELEENIPTVQKNPVLSAKERLCKQCIVKLEKCDKVVARYTIMKKGVENIDKCDHDAETEMVQNIDDSIEISDDELIFGTVSPTISLRDGSPSLLCFAWDNQTEKDADDLRLLDIEATLEDNQQNGRTSPVIEVFEMIANINNLSVIKKDRLTEKSIHLFKCDSDCFATKRTLRFIEKSQSQVTFQVSSLISTVLKFFENNNILNFLKSWKQAGFELTQLHQLKRKSFVNDVTVNKKQRKSEAEPLINDFTISEVYEPQKFNEVILEDTKLIHNVHFDIELSGIGANNGKICSNETEITISNLCKLGPTDDIKLFNKPLSILEFVEKLDSTENTAINDNISPNAIEITIGNNYELKPSDGTKLLNTSANIFEFVEKSERNEKMDETLKCITKTDTKNIESDNNRDSKILKERNICNEKELRKSQNALDKLASEIDNDNSAKKTILSVSNTVDNKESNTAFVIGEKKIVDFNALLVDSNASNTCYEAEIHDDPLHQEVNSDAAEDLENNEIPNNTEYVYKLPDVSLETNFVETDSIKDKAPYAPIKNEEVEHIVSDLETYIGSISENVKVDSQNDSKLLDNVDSTALVNLDESNEKTKKQHKVALTIPPENVLKVTSTTTLSVHHISTCPMLSEVDEMDTLCIDVSDVQKQPDVEINSNILPEHDLETTTTTNTYTVCMQEISSSPKLLELDNAGITQCTEKKQLDTETNFTISPDVENIETSIQGITTCPTLLELDVNSVGYNDRNKKKQCDNETNVSIALDVKSSVTRLQNLTTSTSKLGITELNENQESVREINVNMSPNLETTLTTMQDITTSPTLSKLDTNINCASGTKLNENKSAHKETNVKITSAVVATVTSMQDNTPKLSQVDTNVNSANISQLYVEKPSNNEINVKISSYVDTTVTSIQDLTTSTSKLGIKELNENQESVREINVNMSPDLETTLTSMQDITTSPTLSKLDTNINSASGTKLNENKSAPKETNVKITSAVVATVSSMQDNTPKLSQVDTNVNSANISQLNGDKPSNNEINVKISSYVDTTVTSIQDLTTSTSKLGITELNENQESVREINVNMSPDLKTTLTSMQDITTSPTLSKLDTNINCASGTKLNENKSAHKENNVKITSAIVATVTSMQENTLKLSQVDTNVNSANTSQLYGDKPSNNEINVKISSYVDTTVTSIQDLKTSPKPNTNVDSASIPELNGNKQSNNDTNVITSHDDDTIPISVQDVTTYLTQSKLDTNVNSTTNHKLVKEKDFRTEIQDETEVCLNKINIQTPLERSTDDNRAIQEIEQIESVKQNMPLDTESRETLLQDIPAIYEEKLGEQDNSNTSGKDSVDQPVIRFKSTEYKHPVIGTCYVLSPVENNLDTSSPQITEGELLNDSSEELIEIIKIVDEDEFAEVDSISDVCDSPLLGFDKNDKPIVSSSYTPKHIKHRELNEDKERTEECDIDTQDNLEIIVPNKTYKTNTLKRKFPTEEYSIRRSSAKKYRKSKNIDCPNVRSQYASELSYCKEFKCVIEYINTIEVSLARNYQKDIVDVDECLENWPIVGEVPVNVGNSDDKNENILFHDEEKTLKDPLKQTLVEEIMSDSSDSQYPTVEEPVTNFNMGFGERSGRVIQNLKEGGDISKFSAAILSDVKQTQPLLQSEDFKVCKKYKKTLNNGQREQLRRYLTYIQLKDKVRSYFDKMKSELSHAKESKRKQNSYDVRKILQNVPGLYGTEFLEPPPLLPLVNVVQVGQLPVSAAAQNPVTCDPRVTQVSDASPSQCSVENSPGSDNNQTIKAEYTELTTADLSLPRVQDLTEQNMKPQEKIMINDEQSVIPREEEFKEEANQNMNRTIMIENNQETIDYEYDANANEAINISSQLTPDLFTTEPSDTEYMIHKPENGPVEKTDQLANAMNAAGIRPDSPDSDTRAHQLVNIISQNVLRKVPTTTVQTSTNNYSKINAYALQQALASILPPPLNHTSAGEGQQTQQVLHIVQGKNASGNQITLVDNSQQSVLGNNATQVLHIVQKSTGATNGNPNTQGNSFSGISLVDAGLQQGGNQLLHIVNTGSQKGGNPSQLLKRVNLLTNLTNVPGGNEQKMVQFVCKSADGKAIHLNAPHQRSMVLRLQPIETPNVQHTVNKSSEPPDLSPTQAGNNLAAEKDLANQQGIKSRSVYEENYAKFIQNSSGKSAVFEKSTSLPKFNQAFGKPVFQEGTQKQGEMDHAHITSVHTSENAEPAETPVNLEHISQISNPPLLLRKTSVSTSSQAQPNLVQQLKQTIAPMNIQTMHGGVIYTRQIPVNIGGGQTINLITVPSTELIDESGQKQQTINQNDMEPSIIKIVPQSQPSEGNGEDNAHVPNDNPQPSQPQPVLTQMRIKLPMLSKTQQLPGTRVVRPSFFQIQRNVIGGANQPVYQQLVLTAAPPLGQQTIRLPQTRQVKVPTETTASPESQLSSSTLEQLREFDMVLEQVKERSTVQPGTTNTYSKLHNPSTDTTDSVVSVPSSSVSVPEPTPQQVLYSVGNSLTTSTLNVAYVNRKSTVTTSTSSSFVRSPDSSGIVDSPSSSNQVPTSVVSEAQTPAETPPHPKPSKHSKNSKNRPPKPSSSTSAVPSSSSSSSSHPPNAAMKINHISPKTSTQKPLEDEQTTQRILYILAEYKEQVENSPDKDKPAPRRRSNLPTTGSGSSKRKKSSSGRRHGCTRDHSPITGDDSGRTMGSEDSSCGTSQGDCTESCSIDTHSPQDSPRKIVRKLSFEPDQPAVAQPRPQPPRNVIVADGQTITVARTATGKPTTAVLMPANYILPVSMVKGGQQIAIVTNRGPKLLTVGGATGEGAAANALLLQRLIGPAGLKPVLARPGVRQVRLPTAALHNLQAFNLTAAVPPPPSDSTASPAPAPNPPELIETRATSSPWNDAGSDVKPERGSSPETTEPWNLQTNVQTEYTYEEPTTRNDSVDRTVLAQIPDRYSPDLEAQRIFDKMFDVDAKKSYIGQDDSPRVGHGYDIDPSHSDCEEKSYHQVVHKKDGSSHSLHRVTHISSAALRHKYAILEHELRLQKSLSEECEDLGVDSPSASDLFPEAELLFAASPAAHEHVHSQTPQPTLNQHSIPQPDLDDQIATDQLLPPSKEEELSDVNLELGDVGIVTVSEDGMQATIQLDQEEFARSHPNTTFHSEPNDDGEEVQPFSLASSLKGRHITSTIFHSNGTPATVLMATPQQTVISQVTPETSGAVNNNKYNIRNDIDNMIHNLPAPHGNPDVNLSSVLVKDEGLTRFDNILTDSRELHLSNTASAIVHNATQVIRRVCYDDDKRDRFLMDEPDTLIAGNDAKMAVAEDSCSRDATLESMGDDEGSSPERHAELFWESNSASERSESRRPLDFSSDSEKCCKSPSLDETNSTDSSGVGTHLRLDSVIKEARSRDRSGSLDCSSADDTTHPPIRTYPPKRSFHNDGDVERSLTGKTRAGERSPDSPEIRRRASARDVVKRGCHCCNGSPAPPRPKKPRQRKPTLDFTHSN